jgi:hypothetical protein
VSFSSPAFVNPSVQQFSLGVQRALPWRITVDLAYVGSRTRQQQNRWGGFNEPPLSLRDRCDITKGGIAAICDELLPNPFYGVSGFEGSARFTNPTLSRYELSRPFPQFGPITMLDRNDGRIWYDSAQLTVNRRMSDGVAVAGSYTWSKTIEENGGDNQIGGTSIVNPLIVEADRIVQRSPTESDRRHRLTTSGVFRLPFGRDRRYLRTGHPLVEALAGGWDVAALSVYSTGRPWGLPQNVFYVKDAAIDAVDFGNPRVIRAVQPCVGQMDASGTVSLLGYSVAAGCTAPNFIIRPNYTSAGTQFRDARIRRPPYLQFDVNVAKTTRMTDRLRLQIRVEIFNVFNQAVYDSRQYENNPSNALFGSIDRSVVRQSNAPRYGQLGVKLLF